MKKILCSAFAVAVFLLAGCSAIDSPNSASPAYQSYRDIPGVTQADTSAVEELLAKNAGFVYGFPLSTEAFYEEDGSIGGFVTLMFGRMSELFGIAFTPQVCEWDELLAKIESKEIDFTGEFTPTTERLAKYFMTDTLIQRSIKVFTNRNNEDLAVIAQKRPVRCGFINGSTVYTTVAASWDMPFEPVFIGGESEVTDYFISGKIDAYIDESVMEALFDAYDFIKSAEYYPLSYSPVSLTTGNPELVPVINVMQKYLQNGGLAELAALYNQGINSYLKHKLSTFLTEEEKEYIKQHNSGSTAIFVGSETDNYPSSFYNKKEKEFQGAALDVLNQISELTGLRFKPGNTPATPWEQLFASLENGEYSLVTELFQVDSRQGRFLWSEEPYYIDNYALLSRADFPNVGINQILFSKVGLIKGTAYTDVFLEWFPDSVNTVMYTNNDEAFAALERGEVDFLMMTQNLLLHVTNYLERPYFKVNVVFNYPTGSYFGFNKNEEILRSIIDKAQRYVDTEAITDSWTRKVFDYNSKMLKDMIPFAVIFSSLLVAALAVVAILFSKNKKTSRNLERLVAERTNELELQTSTLATIFESIPDLVFCKDSDFNFTRCNRSFKEHFGCADKNIIGKNDVEAFGLPVEMMETFREADMRIMCEGQPITIEEIIPAADGTSPVFETIKTPMMQNGKPVGIMGISRDITQRKVAEETLKLTLNNLNTCIYITEPETDKILFINEKMAREFGKEEYLGKVCWEVFQDGFTERCSFCPIPRLLESGEEYCVWEEHNTATNRHYENTDSIIKWHDGRLVHMQHSVDITDAVRLQQDLEHASRAKGDFLSRMSHEIRTPLNAIIGMNNIALNSNDLGKTHQCHQKIESASKHLLGVINDILDMSKIEADKFELSNSEFDFEKMLMNIINVTHFRSEEKRQELVVNLGKDVPALILSDELRLSQVITNLLSNAIKFTPENGSILLNIRKTDEAADEVTLQIEVVDNGIGISAEQQTRLFTSFEQADGSISRKFGGTGLGLAISKRIVELMGGRIWIESETGRGSTFAFTIKVKQCEKAPSKRLSPKINKNDLRILAADDSEDTLLCFSHMMEAHGLPCGVALSGAKALEMIKQCGDKPYNIFFVDWQMPEMDGIQLTRKIKEITGDNSIVFMISVGDWNTIEKDALAAGVKGFIPKPLFPSSIINAINECLGVESAKAEKCAQSTDICPDFKGRSILIAEDIEINQEIMVAVLEETGLAVDFADNGTEAVAMFRANHDKYSLIFMDIQMPEMDGYEATRIIRALDLAKAKSIPIIAMTANVFKEDVENCLAAGMNDHVGKPVDSRDLFDKLRTYLD